MLSPRARVLARLGALVAVLVAVAVALRFGALGDAYRPERLVALVQQARHLWWAPPLFVALYVAACTLAVPGTVLTLAGGAAFGFWYGSLFNYVGATLGAAAAFWLARRLGRDGIRALAGTRLAGVDRVAGGQGFIWLLRLRLIPLIPFNALNFGAGLTAMPLRAFVFATALGIIPGTLVYTFFADALVAGARDASRGAFLRVALAGALLILLTLIPTLWRRRSGIDHTSAPIPSHPHAPDQQ